MELQMDKDKAMKKRKTDMETEIYTIPSKTAKAREVKPLQPLSTKNQFNPLQSTSKDDDEEEISDEDFSEAEQETPQKKKFLPPVVIHKKPISEQILESIQKMMKGEYIIEYVAQGLRIKMMEQDDHDKLTQTLMEEQIEYYTFDARNNKVHKFVLRGLPPAVSCSTIKDSLLVHRVPALQVRQMTKSEFNSHTRKLEKRPLPVWVITVEKTPESTAAIKSINGMFHFRIKIEEYKNSQSLQQCFRCQQFGHKAGNCHLKEKCVKCAGSHNTRDCKKSDSTPAKCVNCGDAHPANYRQCPEAVRYTTKMDNIKRRPQQQPRLQDFPSLPQMDRRIPGFQRPIETKNNEDEFGMKEILKFLQNGKITYYIREFKKLVNDIKTQPDVLSKVITFFTGAIEILTSNSNGQQQ